MKVFFKKLKKANKIMEVFYFITLIGYWVTYGLLVANLLSLTGIETVIRIIVISLFALYGLIYTIFGLVTLFKNKKIIFTILTILTILFGIVFSVASYYIDFIYSKIENFVTSETSTYTTVLLSLKETEFTNDSIIGMISDDTDRTGYLLPLELIQKENIQNEITYYDNYTELLNALYNKEVDAIFVNKDYAILYGGEQKFSNIANETTVIKEYSKEMKTEESELLVSTKSLTEPFTVLVLGVDSESTNGLDANAAFNGDTLMLITFNPKTLNATMLSLPRDTYVPIYNSSNRNIGYNKINSSAAYGTASTVNTIENLTGIEIDYFVKVNFQGVIDLVNALGGIDVDVEQPDYDYYVSQYGEGRLCESNSLRDTTNLVCMNTGFQHLNGEQALAYARNRYGFLEGDIARNRHQQQVIEAIAKKLVQTSSFSDFENLLDTISNNIATNMKTSQILSFYQSIKGMLSRALNGEEFISIQKLQLTYFTFDNQYGLSCVGYYQGSLDKVVETMEENLGLKDISTVKTFSYDYSEDYEQTSDIIGKGIYSGGQVPDQSIYGNNNNDNNDDENTDEPTDPIEQDPNEDNNEDQNNNEENNEDDNNNNEDDNNDNNTSPEEPGNNPDEPQIPGTPTDPDTGDDNNEDQNTDEPTTPTEPTTPPTDTTSDENNESQE